jgi:hypothetical protein
MPQYHEYDPATKARIRDLALAFTNVEGIETYNTGELLAALAIFASNIIKTTAQRGSARAPALLFLSFANTIAASLDLPDVTLPPFPREEPPA